MTDALKVFIETLPPTTNQAYRFGKGHFYMTTEGKAWKQGAQLAIQAAHSAGGWPAGCWRKKSLSVKLTFFDKSALTYDVDGRAKLALDAVADGLGFDDRYVMELILKKRTAAIPGVEVLVQEFQGFGDAVRRWRVVDQEAATQLSKAMDDALTALGGLAAAPRLSDRARMRVQESLDALTVAHDILCEAIVFDRES